MYNCYTLGRLQEPDLGENTPPNLQPLHMYKMSSLCRLLVQHQQCLHLKTFRYQYQRIQIHLSRTWLLDDAIQQIRLIRRPKIFSDKGRVLRNSWRSHSVVASKVETKKEIDGIRGSFSILRITSGRKNPLSRSLDEALAPREGAVTRLANKLKLANSPSIPNASQFGTTNDITGSGKAGGLCCSSPPLSPRHSAPVACDNPPPLALELMCSSHMLILEEYIEKCESKNKN
ncbi:hypothetical protein BJ165DRAFT_1572296 [Panaeolus papilionaceus]|nr:hypothetical protein BJ165DRAFT_1572296 [Panaeolus papilionaceus]